MGFFETRKSNLEVLWQEQPEEPLRPSSQRDCYWREHKKLCRENTNTEVALARTEHETDHHKKKVPSVFCITKYQTSFLRAHAPYRREENKGALPASESSLFPVWEMTQKTQRELGLVPLLHLTWSQPLEQVWLARAQVQDMPSSSPTHQNQSAALLQALHPSKHLQQEQQLFTL